MPFFDVFKALLGHNGYKANSDSPAENFLRTLYTASKCRYVASSRLKNKGMFAFATTTALSLGLIFIPLMQNAGLELSLPDQVLNMIQIFLAVSVLVYSTINSQAGYQVGAEN